MQRQESHLHLNKSAHSVSHVVLVCDHKCERYERLKGGDIMTTSRTYRCFLPCVAVANQSSTVCHAKQGGKNGFRVKWSSLLFLLYLNVFLQLKQSSLDFVLFRI